MQMVMPLSCLYKIDLCVFVRMNNVSHRGFFQHIQKSTYTLLPRHKRVPTCPFKSVCNNKNTRTIHINSFINTVLWEESVETHGAGSLCSSLGMLDAMRSVTRARTFCLVPTPHLHSCRQMLKFHLRHIHTGASAGFKTHFFCLVLVSLP